MSLTSTSKEGSSYASERSAVPIVKCSGVLSPAT